MIELKGVTKDYPMGEVVYHALRGIDLKIERGEGVVVTGASGSGKSTLLHVMGALHRPTSGEIFLDGKELSLLSREGLARIRNAKIGFAFQRFYLLPRANALYNVELPLIYAGVNPRERQQRARECLEKVGLLDHAHHVPNQLSGGESQRVAIARALVNSPPLLLADEPTGNLDSHTSREIMDIFFLLNEEGKTVVLVTHERDLAAQAKRVIVLRDGRIEKDNYGNI
jgi:putative ABC transport system ATP-binding protein